MDAITDGIPRELKPDATPVVALRATRAADVRLLERLAAVLTGGDTAVRLTVLLELYDRHTADEGGA